MLLEKGVNPRINNNLNKSPLSIAVAKGNLTVIQMLLEKGADPNAYSLGLMMPLSLWL